MSFTKIGSKELAEVGFSLANDYKKNLHKIALLGLLGKWFLAAMVLVPLFLFSVISANTFFALGTIVTLFILSGMVVRFFFLLRN